MRNVVEVTKDLTGQQSIPSVWRAALTAIVDCIRKNDFSVWNEIPGALPLGQPVSIAIKEGIRAYGDRLEPLPERAWDTSLCQWTGSYWDALVDLFTERDGASDLVLFVRVAEAEAGFTFEVLSVHVP